MKKPTIYYNTDNPLEISFEKLPGYKRVDKNYPCGLEAFKLPSAEAVRGAAMVLPSLVPDYYCYAFDKDLGVLAYTSKDFDSVVWHDFS